LVVSDGCHPERSEGPLIDAGKVPRDAGLTEDRQAACAIQAGLASRANSHFTFGHFEQAIGHLHRHLTEHVEMLKTAD
jgi:hypothetical protein